MNEHEDDERLMTAKQVAALLAVPVKSVYGLPIPQVRISARRIRWRRAAVLRHIRDRHAVAVDGAEAGDARRRSDANPT